MKDDPKFPIEDWRYDVANGVTFLGYIMWKEARREMQDYYEAIEADAESSDTET